MNLQIVSLIVVVLVDGNAVTGESTRHQTLNGLIGLLAGREPACGNGRMRHQSILSNC
jgi:hypothetical protein